MVQHMESMHRSREEKGGKIRQERWEEREFQGGRTMCARGLWQDRESVGKKGFKNKPFRNCSV